MNVRGFRGLVVVIGEDGSERPPRIYTPGMDEDASSPRLPQLRVASRDPRGPIANRTLPCLMTMDLWERVLVENHIQAAVLSHRMTSCVIDDHEGQ